MNALFALLAQAAAIAAPAPAPVRPPEVTPTIPSDWRALAPLPWRAEPHLTPDITRFVADEVKARRCATAAARSELAVDMAVMVRADGAVRWVVPRAIDCPTVEQFAAGLVTSLARNNVRLPAEGWYRTTVTFALAR